MFDLWMIMFGFCLWFFMLFNFVGVNDLIYDMCYFFFEIVYGSLYVVYGQIMFYIFKVLIFLNFFVVLMLLKEKKYWVEINYCIFNIEKVNQECGKSLYFYF